MKIVEFTCCGNLRAQYVQVDCENVFIVFTFPLSQKTFIVRGKKSFVFLTVDRKFPIDSFDLCKQ